MNNEKQPEVLIQQPGVQQVPQQPLQYGAIMQQDVQYQIPFGCPPGLEYLTQLDQLIVKQQIELLEAFTGFETNNKYKIQNSLGQPIYFAMEDTDCMTRYCCGPGRPFEMQILDNSQREVMHLHRPLRCQGCCCWCCLQEIDISASGQSLGHVIQKWSLWKQKLEILDANRTPVLLIEGPCLPCRCCADVEFKILALDGETQVGRISKQWSGFGKEFFTDADTFGITFPMDLDVKMKAVMLGACFLIDFMFFEKKQNW